MKTFTPSGFFARAMRTRAVVLPLAMLLGFIVIPDLLFSMEKLIPHLAVLGPWILLLIVLTLIMAEVSNFFFKKSRITISDDYLERSNGKSKDVIKFADILKVKVNSFKSKIYAITIKSKKAKMLIFSFEEMSKIVELIKKNLDDPSLVKEKKYRIPTYSAFFQGLIFVLAAVALSVFFEFNPSLLDSTVVPSLGFVIGGILFLFLRPIAAERGKRYLFLDIFFGLMFLVGGVLFFFTPMN